MTATRPPAVANWLVTRFVGGPMRESLIGDIDEQFARGRSASWYWRQVPAAILSGLKADLRERPLAVMCSVILTSLVTGVWVEFTSSLYGVMDRWVNPWTNSSFVLFEFWIPFGGGTCLLWCLAPAFAGRIGARVTGGSRAVLAGILLTHVAVSLWLTRDFWLHGAFTNTVSPSLWVANYLWAAVVLIGMPISTIVGALWDADGSSSIAAEHGR